MDYKYIEQLIDRYFEAETTREEEQILRSFFSQENVPAELRSYQALFRYEQEASQMKLSDDFDAKILATIQQPVVKARRISLSTRLQPFYRAAAIVAIILTVGNAAQRSFNTEEEDEMEISYSTPYTDPAAATVTTAAAITSEGTAADTLKVKELPDQK